MLQKKNKNIFSINPLLTNSTIIHFIGIGGMGMSCLAKLLHYYGYNVQGSDLLDNINIKNLRNEGIHIFLQHHKNNLKKVKLVVISSAIQDNNPELIAAERESIPIIHRSKMLSLLMTFKNSISIAGTHGKTTTTALIAAVLDKYDPTVINGGIMNRYNTNLYIGNGKWIIVEADESDGTFLKIPTIISIITNIDYDHINYWHNINNLYNAFIKFVQNI